MKRLLLPLLAAISFSIPVFANTPPSVRNPDWITDGMNYLINNKPEMVAATAIILGIIFVILLFLLANWLTPSPEEKEAEARRNEQLKKEKLISYGHDMKGLEGKYRELHLGNWRRLSMIDRYSKRLIKEYVDDYVNEFGYYPREVKVYGEVYDYKSYMEILDND